MRKSLLLWALCAAGCSQGHSAITDALFMHEPWSPGLSQPAHIVLQNAFAGSDTGILVVAGTDGIGAIGCHLWLGGEQVVSTCDGRTIQTIDLTAPQEFRLRELLGTAAGAAYTQGSVAGADLTYLWVYSKSRKGYWRVQRVAPGIQMRALDPGEEPWPRRPLTTKNDIWLQELMDVLMEAKVKPLGW